MINSIVCDSYLEEDNKIVLHVTMNQYGGTSSVDFFIDKDMAEELIELLQQQLKENCK